MEFSEIYKRVFEINPSLKGKIEIEYYSAAELERLIDMIQKIDPNNG